jgi:hypothetical protein
LKDRDPGRQQPCWLAHRAAPLSQTGHGKVLAASILATRSVVPEASSRQQTVKIAFINGLTRT